MFFPQKLTIKWIKQAYKNGDLTPEMLVEEIIKRSNEKEDYNVWITEPNTDLINPYIEQLANKPKDLPLWGIPFAIKDNIDLKGVPTTAACPVYGYVPKESAMVVQKLIDAGAIPIGKTNLDQFATGLVGTRSPYGEVKNALQPEMISGGSSSGSAVSVALGLATFSLGTDTAGSGRVPAMLNNLVGYKPPIGSWSGKGVVPACESLDCVTVFANNLEESLLIDSLVRGYDEKYKWSRKINRKEKKGPLKVYLPKDEPKFYGTWESVYKEKWNKAKTRLENLDIETEYIDYDMFQKAALILYEGAYVAERWSDLGEFVNEHPNDIFPVTKKILSSGKTEEKTAARLFSDIHKLAKYKHIANELLEDAVLIMPTAGGSFTREEVRNNPIETNSLMGLYTNHCNLLDLAAIAIPENSEDKEYPFGITLFSLHNNENLITEVATRFLETESTELAVCGLHKNGYPLESQITELGGKFSYHAHTTDAYRLYELPSNPVKPGLVKKEAGSGEKIEVDIFEIPKNKLGEFMSHVSTPLTIGDIELENGKTVKGFLCQEYAAKNAKDITSQKSFNMDFGK